MTRLAPPPRLLVLALLVFGVALGLRLWHLAGLRQHWEGTQLYSMARGDAADHWREAQEIVRGEHPLGTRVPWKGVGYSYYLAGLMRLVGNDPGRLRIPNAVLGALNCALLVLLVGRRLSPSWSLVAGLLAACNGVLILFDGELFFPTLLIALSLVSLLLLGTRRWRLPSTAAAGVCMGLATIVHGVYLIPTFALAMRLVRGGLATALAFGIAAALAILPTSLATLVGTGQPVLLSWNGGINLFLGGQPNFDQASGQSTSAWSRVLASTEESGLSREVDRDRHYLRLALKQWTRHPLESTRVLGGKIRALLSPIEISNNVRLYELRDASPVLRTLMGKRGNFAYPFALWLPAALLGAWSLWRRRRLADGRDDLVGLIAFWSCGLVLSILISFNTARYRAPLVFFGSLFVAYALSRLAARWRRGGPRAVIAPLLVYVGLVVTCSMIAMPQRALPSPAAWSQTLYLEASGRVDEARDWLGRALVEDPDDPWLLLEATRFEARHGDGETADAFLARVFALPDLEPDLRVYALEEAAFAAMRRGDWEAARAALGRALAMDVDRGSWRDHPNFHVELEPVTRCRLELLLADVELRAQQPESAQASWRSARQECPSMSGDLAQMARRVELQLRVPGARARSE